MSLTGKVVVVTGASSGIGRAIALLLAEKGAKIVLGARGEEKLAQIAAAITESGGEAVCASTDVSRHEDVKRLVQLAIEHYGKLDVLVNNAGVMPISPLDELKVADWEAMVDINIKGVLYGIAEALPIFRRQEFGHFINIASTSAHRVVPAQAVYAGTKFAVRAISEGLRQEAGDKLRVTIISPGMTRTEFVESMTDPVVRAQAAIAMPPRAVAEAVAFAIEQPEQIDIGEIVIRPTAQN
ncbi:SDR family oxidoreductase [Saccharibacillus sp. CPCC 101409]|uniref:SDR family oxidoreductase n=1 Tax=Saccharibacillus sp. CPCC 101409 TaxID=3058041 RepID=UPI0026729EF3|nr:SDR family oxidoreductase [Saccharibacillus sp. CPCC 101409]MDO3412228.1 SDR family oxidoreductase [Saccharibacillus sp. CPCC 101409]